MTGWLIGFIRALVLAALLAPTCAAAGGQTSPRRIVSLNLCGDEILLDLVAPARIAAVSHLASDARVSPIVERVRGLAATRGDAEAILALDPDLVIAGSWTTPATISILERIGRRVVKMPPASGIESVANAIRQIAAAVGEVGKGEELVRGFERELAAAKVGGDAARRPSALIYQVNGLSSGVGSLPDALLAAAGFKNHAGAIGLGAGGALPLETLLANPPDLLILSGPADEYRTVVAENLRHPAFVAFLATHRSVTIPWRLWLCETQYAGQALKLLVAARKQLSSGGGRK